MAIPLSLYVHFPWCVRKCPYCDFNSYTLHGEVPERQYVQALERDLAAQLPEVAGREVVSIFLGGGTPSLFSPEVIGGCLDTVRQKLTVATDAEVTMEANPGTIERGRFSEYRAAGLTRVSLGAQTFDPERLAALGRIHTPEETRRAAEELHLAGLDNFNLDLMYALPGQDLAGAVQDVEEALALGPAHVSHYQLTLESGTVFAAHPPALPDDDLAADMLLECRARLDRAEFAQYEVSGYAQPGRQCRHNLNYWTFGDYVGLGAGAHGKLTRVSPDQAGPSHAPWGRVSGAPSLTIVRTAQTREPRRYVAAGPSSVIRRTLPEVELPFEFMLNALRLVNGFDISLFSERTGLAWQAVAAEVSQLVGRGLLERRGSRCRPTAHGLRFLNEILLTFLRETPRTTGSFALSTAV